jgi:hypothetical protein
MVDELEDFSQLLEARPQQQEEKLGELRRSNGRLNDRDTHLSPYDQVTSDLRLSADTLFDGDMETDETYSDMGVANEPSDLG